MKANQKLRDRMHYNSIPAWQVAKKIGVAEITIHRWLRLELPEEKRETIDRAISEIIAERE